MEKFIEEAKILAKFRHPSIVRALNFFQENGTAYLVMDYYEGKNLAEYLEQKGGKLDEETVIKIMLPLLDGLKEVHKNNFLHRDIKPQNIYLIKDKPPIKDGSEFRVNTYTTDNQDYPSLAIDNKGNFIISWQSQDSFDEGIYVQKYNKFASLNGSEFKINTYTTDSQIESVVSMDNLGNYVVTWVSG